MICQRLIPACVAVALQVSLGVSLAALPGAAQAQSAYPNKPMRWVVPYAPGGGADVIARPIAQKVTEMLGQQVIYDNRGGGGGLIGAEFVARSAPDGYTFLVAAGNTHVFATLLNDKDKVPFDPVKDFATITKFATIPLVLVANPGFPPKTIPELVAWGKANPGKINWASSGNGSGGHLAMVLLTQSAGLKVTHVPYKGAAPASTATMAGETHLQFTNTGVALAPVKAGKLRALGVAALKRLPVVPDLPTIAESGFPGFESSTFYGLVAPAGTPAAIIRLQHDTLVKIINTPDIQARFASDGTVPVGNTPEQFAEELRVEVAKWAKIIRENNIKAD